MIHIGTSDYYSQVHNKLNECDIILFEGVRTFRARVITLSYRIVARRKRLRLVTQNAYLLRGVRGKVIHADVAPGEFNDHWSQIPWHIRMAILLVAPLHGAYQFVIATRESLGKKMQSEDLPTADEAMRGEFEVALDTAIKTSRDAKLIAAIDSVIAAARTRTTIGIVYGAGHMKAVTAALMERHDYKVAKSEWIRVFDYAPGG